MSDPYNTIGKDLSNLARLPIKQRAAPESKPSWWSIRKIARLAGRNDRIRVDPVQVAAATLEKASAGRIKSIFVSLEWDDGTLAVDWSEMKRSALIAHAFNVQTEVQDEVRKP